MIISLEKPGTPAELVHVGVKGMRWGFRKEEPRAAPRMSANGVKGLENFPKEQAVALDLVAGKMKAAYGFKIDEVIPIADREHRKYIAYVEIMNRGSNVVHMRNTPTLNATLHKLHDDGWFVPSGGHNFEGIVTHEAAHSMFHSVDAGDKAKFKTSIDDIRESAWKKAEVQALKDGDVSTPEKGFRGWLSGSDPRYRMSKKLSKYAESSIFLEESEAEIFSAYHWSPNPPKFVDVFMDEVHSQRGESVQPFSGRKAFHA